MTWNRVLHIAGGVSALVIAVGTTIVPLVPPTVGAFVGVAIAIASNLDRILGRQAGQPPTAADKPPTP